MKLNINFAIIINPGGSFGGAQRRFTNLFKYIYEKYPDNAYYIVSYDLFERIKKIYPDYPLTNVIPVGSKIIASSFNGRNNITKSYFSNKSVNNEIGFLRKMYRWTKNIIIQYNIYKEIERLRKLYNISSFMGVYSGILPLYFYLMKKIRNVTIIFCDMDSWFSDILPSEKKYWYRKYSSFNYGLENSDYIDFLSPFIVKGVQERGVKLKEESVSITPCSFTDYSKCKIGKKKTFQAAFAGRLEKDKNPELYLDAAVILARKYPEIFFHIMGEGRLSQIIKERVDKEALFNIVYHGFHPNPNDILAETSVFVSVQTTNNYPSQSVLEAMGCGNVIIATDVGDTRMFINEENGILINLELNELVYAIESLYLNIELSKKLGKNAYTYVRENHTVEKMAEYYISLFEKASTKNVMKW